jgi:hypothetical protein
MMAASVPTSDHMLAQPTVVVPLYAKAVLLADSPDVTPSEISLPMVLARRQWARQRAVAQQHARGGAWWRNSMHACDASRTT